MTRILVAAGLLAAVLACTPTAGAPESDMGSHDCTKITTCERGCATAACATSCVSNGSTKGKGEYANALGCDQEVCAGMHGLTARCMLDTSTNTFVDFPGVTGDCAACLNAATARLFGVSCVSASDPYCNPSVCKSATDVCLGD